MEKKKKNSTVLIQTKLSRKEKKKRLLSKKLKPRDSVLKKENEKKEKVQAMEEILFLARVE